MSKPTLMLPSAAVGVATNAGQTAEAALTFLAESGDYYRKGGFVVRLIDDKAVGHRLTVLTPQMFQTVLFERMNVIQWPGRANRPNPVAATEIKDSTLKTILGSIYVERYVPSIAVVAKRSYLVVVNGELVLLKPGYNPERNGIYVVGSEVPEDVPVNVAVAVILNLFRDFNFATPSDMSRAVAAVLCAVMRLAGIFERHPLLAFEANESQAGKTKLWAMICAIIGQPYGVVAQKKGGVGSLDEQLMENLVDGRVAILFDNLRGKLDSCVLESCLTPEDALISARIAGVRGIQVDPRPVLFGLTSNGVEVTIDLANRMLITRILKQPGSYQFHEWKDAQGNVVDIRLHIASYQSIYLGAVNAIIRDWWNKGAKRLPCTEHDFKDCIGALDFMVQEYFKLPPLLSGHKAALDRTTKPGLSWLRQVALVTNERWFVTEWTATSLAERCILDGIPLPGGASEADTEAAARQIGIAMGNAFGTSSNIVIDNITVTRTERKGDKSHDRKFYTFSRTVA